MEDINLMEMEENQEHKVWLIHTPILPERLQISMQQLHLSGKERTVADTKSFPQKFTS